MSFTLYLIYDIFAICPVVENGIAEIEEIEIFTKDYNYYLHLVMAILNRKVLCHFSLPDMAISRQFDVELSRISTFQMGGKVAELVSVETEQDLKELFMSMAPDRKWFILGGGSNVVFPDGDSDITLIQFTPQPIRFEKKSEEEIYLIAPAGAVWDTVVAEAVEHGLSGIEALSAIPGSVGATPIQNVGAYGVEIADVFDSVRAFDTETKKHITLSNSDCRFGYRDSMFKHEGKGRYIITEVTYLLSTDEPNVPQYPGVAEYLAGKNITRASLSDIRDAIISIRSSKLPDPRTIPSVGSFFKNPFVPIELATKLKAEFPSLAVFPVNESLSKVGAGSLIDVAGLKGKRFGNISIYKNNALVLVNEGGATREELKNVVAMIVDEVQKKFGVAIEPEPELLEF